MSNGMHQLTEDERVTRFAAGVTAGRELRALHGDDTETINRLATFDEGMAADGSIFTEFNRGRAAGLRGA